MAVARWRAWLAGPAPALFRWPAAKQLQHKPDPLRARRHGVGSAPLCGPGSGHATRAQGAGARQGATTRVARNANFGKLQAGYLFPEIARRRRAHQEAHPDAQIISLGIGDTTEPLPPYIANAMAQAAAGLATREGYSGYGAEQGQGALREAIASTFYPGLVAADEVFVSDGSKCDISRIQS
ncbi:hypothetical protein MNEG_3401 [Monoraphidium neglectum]|uniref:LL-diaminopimelate aminotransferase n=1 Tax=Monoraphidium neglectum TaxID=145388 RepID=A0A0D2MPG0_9CHLO|nr:hypothetical protein MNEG_3401 [Monoraphidium neglectum]KIZ04565.1 hypothetical protein MNEG_3401 [Monoraphidium neglectum]|eukprot:XP_013903584.1 hypothetical protein MNEG_3401 [Monoraphidium neglectum]